MKKKQLTNYEIYCTIREFHKNELFKLMDGVGERMKNSEEDASILDALKTLSGVMYLVESGLFRGDS